MLPRRSFQIRSTRLKDGDGHGKGACHRGAKGRSTHDGTALAVHQLRLSADFHSVMRSYSRTLGLNLVLRSVNVHWASKRAKKAPFWSSVGGWPWEGVAETDGGAENPYKPIAANLIENNQIFTLIVIFQQGVQHLRSLPSLVRIIDTNHSGLGTRSGAHHVSKKPWASSQPTLSCGQKDMAKDTSQQSSDDHGGSHHLNASICFSNASTMLQRGWDR